ncbi:hypothetical protein ACFE04_000342 [Oxalis oulophora]
MDNKKPSSSSTVSFDNLFGPKQSSSSTTAIFGSVYSSPSTGSAGKQNLGNQGGKSGERNHIYQNAKAEPSYLSSSIHYGGQENYSPKSTEYHHVFKKNEGDNDPNSNGASRGNWWQAIDRAYNESPKEEIQLRLVLKFKTVLDTCLSIST